MVIALVGCPPLSSVLQALLGYGPLWMDEEGKGLLKEQRAPSAKPELSSLYFPFLSW